ncbi:transposase [Candidatus Falkowbacteria bacterium]|nr:transposase [Candidatus Falkowbacteria bacterium]
MRIGAKLVFWDESGISQKASVRRTWSPKGRTPVIVSTGSWRSRSVIGIITCTPRGRKPKLFLRIFKHAIKYPDIIRCLKELHRHVKERIILMWDGLPGHRARATRLFLITQRHWLETHRFPAYAPELNPPEYLFSALKSRNLTGLHVATIDEIDAHIKIGKRRLQRRPDILNGFLKESRLFDKELSI